MLGSLRRDDEPVVWELGGEMFESRKDDPCLDVR